MGLLYNDRENMRRINTEEGEPQPREETSTPEQTSAPEADLGIKEKILSFFDTEILFQKRQ